MDIMRKNPGLCGNFNIKAEDLSNVLDVPKKKKKKKETLKSNPEF